MLLEPFNELSNDFIAELKPKADGVTVVPMKIMFSEFTLKVISKVHCISVHNLSDQSSDDSNNQMPFLALTRSCRFEYICTTT